MANTGHSPADLNGIKSPAYGGRLAPGVLRERRDGYAWYTYEPQKVLNHYPAWKKKWVR